MKNTVITIRQKKREIIIWLVCFFVANIVNLIAILVYKTSFSELVEASGYVFVFSWVIYAILVVMRILFCGLRMFYRVILKKIDI